MAGLYRIAIIGAGIGAEHLEGYEKLPTRFKVSTLCDIDTERARSVLGDDREVEVTGDYRAVLADPAIDLVDICLPPHLHFDMSKQALEAGKHVICEKPLVSSLRLADELAECERKSGRRLFPVFQYRYGPATAQLDTLIKSGLAGKPLVASIETHWNRGADYYSVPWRGTWKGEQGGAVLGHAIHNHDLLCRFFGPVASLCAFADSRVNPIEVEDCASISFQMQNGALATSSVTLGAAADTTRIRFVFENLTAESGTAPYSPADDVWRFTARGTTTQRQIDKCLQSVPHSKSGFAGYFAAIADHLDGKGNEVVNLADGRRSLELVSAVYSSIRRKAVEDLPLNADHELYDGWSL